MTTEKQIQCPKCGKWLSGRRLTAALDEHQATECSAKFGEPLGLTKCPYCREQLAVPGNSTAFRAVDEHLEAGCPNWTPSGVQPLRASADAARPNRVSVEGSYGCIQCRKTISWGYEHTNSCPERPSMGELMHALNRRRDEGRRAAEAEELAAEKEWRAQAPELKLGDELVLLYPDRTSVLGRVTELGDYYTTVSYNDGTIALLVTPRHVLKLGKKGL